MAFSFAKSISSRRFFSVIVVTHLISGVMALDIGFFSGNASKIRFLFKGSITEPSIPIVDLIRIYILLMQIKSGSQFPLSPVRTTRIFFRIIVQKSSLECSSDEQKRRYIERRLV